MQSMTLDAIRHHAPSVFAERPRDTVSAKYRFFPTASVVEGLMGQGFLPVRAQQSMVRLSDRQDFARHMLRFRHTSMTDSAQGTDVPEIVLTNSHDGTSAYRISLGLYRVICTNGLVAQSANIEEVRVRHSGRGTLIDDVIEGSYRVIEQAPKLLEQVTNWKQLPLSPLEQSALAEAALGLRETTLTITPQSLLVPRRSADGRGDEVRDTWLTMNVVQENLMRGGATGHSQQGKRRRLRGIASVDTDTKINRALWVLTERLAALKAG